MRIRTAVTSRLSLSEKWTKNLLRYYSYLIYTFLFMPVIVVALVSFGKSSHPGFPLGGFTLDWYAKLLPPNYDRAIIDAFWRSLFLGVLAAVGSGIVGTATAIGISRSNFKFVNKSHLNLIFTAPLVFPWIVTAIMVLTFFDYVGVYGSFGSLVVGHILITLPFVILIVVSQLTGFDRSLEEAAKNLGAGELRTFYEITLPIIAPGIIAGMLFAFIFSFDNFLQTLFWTTPNYETLPLVIYSRVRTGLTPVVNAVSVLVLLLSMTTALIAERLSSLYRG